jgi:hypothetical protein
MRFRPAELHKLLLVVPFYRPVRRIERHANGVNKSRILEKMAMAWSYVYTTKWPSCFTQQVLSYPCRGGFEMQHQMLTHEHRDQLSSLTAAEVEAVPVYAIKA